MENTFQVISWHSEDVEEEFTITMYGRTKSGKSVACHTTFTPYMYVEAYSDTDVRKELLDGLEKCSIKTKDGWVKKKLYSHIKNIKPLWLKKFYGFTNDKRFRFFRISFQSKEAWKQAYYILRKSKFKDHLYEANIDPMLRFIHYQDIKTTGWVQIDQPTYIMDEDKTTSCDIEIQCRFINTKALNDDLIGPIIIASFDIETYSPDNSFPDPSIPACEVIQIATSYQRYGESKPYKQELFTLKESNDIEGVELKSFKTEQMLLKAWSQSITCNDPDILVGYNIWKFDLEYIYKRAKYHGIHGSINLNRNTNCSSEMYSAKFSSSAYGDNEYNMVSSQGRMQIDLLELYKREHKLVSYSLNSVSEHFLGDKKNDMPIPEMFQRYRDGSKDDICAIGKYCVKDTELPLQLMHKLNDIPNLM
jgi:DNA polymerase delta subunit 1